MRSFRKIGALALSVALWGCATPPAPSVASPTPAMVKAPEAPRPQARPPLKIGFVYVGPVGDAGWTYQHDLARREIERAFGSQVQTTHVERVSEFGDGSVFRDLASSGHTLIFATTFGFIKQIEQVGRERPEVKFEHATGYKPAPNVRNYAVRMYEPAYLAGMLAAGMSRSDRLGVVASIPIPEIVATINAYTLGARAVNPKAVTQVEWLMTWFDPPKEEAAARKLFKRGVDVVFQTTDSSAVVQVAEQLGKRAIAWDSDMKAYGPKAQLAAATVDWAPYYVKTISDVLNQTWTPGSTWWGLTQNAVDLTQVAADVPEGLRKRIDAARQGLRDGSLSIWQGPLRDNRKRLMLAPDKVYSDQQIATMYYLVQGVEGRLP